MTSLNPPPQSRHTPRYSALQTALARAVSEGPSTSAELEASVYAYVAELRDAGLLPEQMLVAVKEMLSPVRASLFVTAQRRLDPAAERGIVEQVVRWSIEVYFTQPLL